MIFTIPMQQGTLLVNVLWKWLVNGAFQAPSASGITQPDSNFPIFRIDTGANAPTGAEELIAYDNTDNTNWNAGGYRSGFAALASAQQILLATLATPGAGTYILAPALSSSQSIARVYGNFSDIGANLVDGTTVTLTLVQVDPTDDTIITDMSGTLIRNKETQQLAAQRVITGQIVAGQLQDLNGNAYISLLRTDYMQDQNKNVLANMRYLLTFPEIGAQVGLFLLSTSSGPTAFQPVSFVLDASNLLMPGAGSLDLSKLIPN
jgi:hypothetical protein